MDVSGDLFDAIPLGDDEILVVVGDVSDKGMAAALYMMGTLTTLCGQAALGCAPADLLPSRNCQLCERNEANMFVTLCVAILSVGSGRLTLLNGGHNPQLLLRHGYGFEVLRQAKGALLGMMPRLNFQIREAELQAGDRLQFIPMG